MFELKNCHPQWWPIGDGYCASLFSVIILDDDLVFFLLSGSHIFRRHIKICCS